MNKIDFEFKINNKFYNEYYARYLLESFYGDSFKNAKIMDRPDIWVESENGGIGVEVTTLIDTYLNTLKKYKKAWSKQQIPLEQMIKNMPSLLRNRVGVNDYGNLVLLGDNSRRTLPKSLSGIEATVKCKLNKLQFYKKFASQNLFIFATSLSQNCTLDKIYEKIKQIDKTRYQNIFDSVMIFDYNNIQVYPMGINASPEIFPVSEDTKFYCDKLAEMEQNKIINKYNEQREQKKLRKKICLKNFKDKNLEE